MAASPATTATPAPTRVAGPTTRLEIRTPVNREVFNKKRLRAPVDRVVITMVNATPEVHNVSLRGNGVFVVGPNVRANRSTIRPRLAAGRYTYYYSILGHTGQRGMLIVS